MHHHSSSSPPHGLPFTGLRNRVQPPDLRRPLQSARPFRPANVARWAAVLLFLGCMIEAALAQEDTATPPPPPRGGLEVRSVTGYFDYYSAGLANGSGFQPSTKLLSDAAGGASIQVGWIKSSERSNSFFTYTSSLTGRVRYSEWNAWNHALSLTTDHKLTPRLGFGFSASGDFSSQEQSLFSATTLSNIASVPATFDDLASAMLSSKFTNPQLASVLTSAPLVESPVRNLLYGQRMFTSAIQTSLSYSYSPRLSISFQAGAGRSQHISQGQAGANRNSYLIPNTTSGSGGLTISYSLSPRTQLGGSVTANRIASSVYDAYTTTSLVTLGRTLASRWLLQVHGGVGVINPLRQTYFLLSTTPHPAAGGSLGYKTFSQSFLGSFDRTVSDSYGLGAATTSSAGVSWRGSRPGRAWWLESSAGWTQLQGNGVGNTSGWRATAGFGRTMGAHLVLFTQYAYVSYSGKLQNTRYGQDQSAARVSVVWSPHPQMPQ